MAQNENNKFKLIYEKTKQKQLEKEQALKPKSDTKQKFEALIKSSLVNPYSFSNQTHAHVRLLTPDSTLNIKEDTAGSWESFDNAVRMLDLIGTSQILPA
jgi:C-terminal processing protease CtpA/Prc